MWIRTPIQLLGVAADRAAVGVEADGAAGRDAAEHVEAEGGAAAAE
jgi:hypothetical protein